MITAPYNFVPLNKEVFYPSWSDEVNHDVPFEDGESGEIEITITAKSPIFVRDSKDESKFCNYNNQFYIPGSSIKGVIRNVLEIMSFSKLRDSNFTNHTYSVRDLRNRELYMSKMKPENTFCGWLKREGTKYIIEDCGVPGRIKHEEIDKIFGIDFATKFKHGNFDNTSNVKTAVYKYNLIDSDKYTYNFSYLKKDVNRELYIYNPNGNKKGTVVLTGQPSARNEPSGKKPSGKIYEFVFFDKKEDTYIDQKTFDNFKFAYFNERTTEPKESVDWTFWKEKLELGEKVPVFFQKEGKKIIHFGLSYLYKLPYNFSIKDGIFDEHFSNKLDLSQTIFGYIDSKQALKGRVQFSHFKAVDNIQELDKVTAILGSPRASYYPNYIYQNNKNTYNTYMDSNFIISGRKRYPIHNSSNVNQTLDTGNDNVGTTFRPLETGIVFRGKLKYHNLKKAELGALLSALTFHNTMNCFHSIGLAKALGYGKIEIKLSNIKNIENYLKEFELTITEEISNWSRSEQLQELLSMAFEQNNMGDSSLQYMKLDNFSTNKNDNNYLKKYTQLDNIKIVSPNTLITEEEIKYLKIQREEKIQKEIEDLKLKKEFEKKLLREQKEQEILEQQLKMQAEKEQREKEKEEKKAEIIEKAKRLEENERLEEQRRIEAKLQAGLDFSKAQDHKGIERALKGFDKSDENILLLEEAILEIYPSLNKKRANKIASSKIIHKWISKERLDELTNSIKICEAV